MEKKLKSERYAALGGINAKTSPYLKGPLEFSDLLNYDFQTPGALTQRWGSTLYMSQDFGVRVHTLYEFAKTDGSSYLIVGGTGGIWSGATTGTAQGLSLTNVGTTYAGFFIYQQVWFDSGGANWNASRQYSLPYQGDFSRKLLSLAFQSSPLTIGGAAHSDNRLSFVTYQDWMYAADGNKFIKFNGISTYAVGLPPGLNAIAATLVTTSSNSSTLGFGFTGTYFLYASYINNRGLESEVWPIGHVVSVGTSFSGSLIITPFHVLTPLSFGISAINIYCYWTGASTILSVDGSNGGTAIWNYPYRLINTFSASGSTFTSVVPGSTVGGQTYIWANNGKVPPPQTYPFLGITLSFVNDSAISLPNFYPRFLEVHKDRVFACGFSSALSTVFFSDAGEPEGFLPENTFECRTNDGDYITAIKSYKTALYIFKRTSVFAFFGDNPSNFYLQELTNQFGCINNRCVVVFNNLMYFLDPRKGVIEFNGANFRVVSDKIQPFFDVISYDGSETTREAPLMVHDKLRNQVITSFKQINRSGITFGATLNDTAVVYDYIADAWTTCAQQTKSGGFHLYAAAACQRELSSRNVFYGYGNFVYFFGPSLLTDAGTGFTISLKSPFLHDMGYSTTEQFRRLYVDIEWTGATKTLAVNFFTNYGASVALGRTMVISEFQNRMEFGLPAKSLAFELANFDTSSPLKIMGFTIESRKQRNV